MWRTVLFSGILAITMTPARAVLLYGNAIGTSGDIHRIDTIARSQTNVATTSPVASRNLNGNGFDGNGKFYFSTWNGAAPNAASKLYFNDLKGLPGSEAFAGDLLGHVAGATIYDGYYWYIDNNTDDLKKVTLDSNGLVASEAKVADISGNSRSLEFGDFVFTGAGLLIGSASDNTGDLFFTYDLVSDIFSSISRNSVLQLAFGSDGVLYGQDAADGRIYSVDPSSDTRTYLFTIPNSIRLTDLAALDAAVPEPTTLALIGIGLAGIGYRRYRSKIAV